MKFRFVKLAPALFASILLVAGCGGGGGGGDGGGGATLSGVAATGAPFAGATITVYDATGAAVGSTTAAADGSYTISIPATARAPLVLEAVRDGETLVSTFSEMRSTRLNITPLTNLIAARLAPDGNPLSLRANPGAVTVQSLNEKVNEVLALIQPLLQSLGDSANPLTGSFSADGSGHDQVLDALSISIRPTGTVANIELTVRMATEQPLKISFTSNESQPAPLPANSVDPTKLPPTGIAQMLAELTARMTACYALPLEQRVSGVGSSSVNAVTGDAASVTAAQCRGLFVGDDPATFLSNGNRVGRDASNNGAFSSLFRRGATGLAFDNAKLEFLRDNSTRDIVFTYRTTDSQGNVAHDSLVARNVAGTLKLIGNQYAYNARVRPWMQHREFLNQAAADYQAVGYNIWIANQVDGGGNPIFSKVVVTAPNGQVLTFKPNGGRSALTVVNSDNTLASTSVIRLAARFKSAATAGAPSQYDTSLYFSSPAYDDEQLRAIPEQGVWTMEFFHADVGQANVIQKYKTISRAPTLAEAAQIVFPELTAAAKDELRQLSAASGFIAFGPPSATTPNVVDASAAGNLDFWTVPGGALAPTNVTAFGRGPDPDGAGPLRGPSFDDGAGVSPAARKVVIQCTRLGVSDTHCDNSTGVMQFAQGSILQTFDLFAVSPRSVEISKHSAMYYLLPR